MYHYLGKASEGGPFEAIMIQFDHHPWNGLRFWDLIQPSFMFLVGTSLAFSVARREKQGQEFLGRLGHALARSVVLVLLGIFLISNGQTMTNFSFVNVLTQIGLGYPLLFLMADLGWRAQAAALRPTACNERPSPIHQTPEFGVRRKAVW